MPSAYALARLAGNFVVPVTIVGAVIRTGSRSRFVSRDPQCRVAAQIDHGSSPGDTIAKRNDANQYFNFAVEVSSANTAVYILQPAFSPGYSGRLHTGGSGTGTDSGGTIPTFPT